MTVTTAVLREKVHVAHRHATAFAVITRVYRQNNAKYVAHTACCILRIMWLRCVVWPPNIQYIS